LAGGAAQGTGQTELRAVVEVPQHGLASSCLKVQLSEIGSIAAEADRAVAAGEAVVQAALAGVRVVLGKAAIGEALEAEIVDEEEGIGAGGAEGGREACFAGNRAGRTRDSSVFIVAGQRLAAVGVRVL
jgi:hypothetical protein